MSLPLIIVGGGGHSRVLLDAISFSGCRVLGIVDTDRSLWGGSVGGIPVLGGEEVLESHATDTVTLVNGLGCVDAPTLQRRKAVYDRLKDRGYRFSQVIHPSVVRAADVVLGEGVQILAGAIVQPAARIGANTIVNTGAIIEHDCRLGASIHIASGAVLAGSVAVDDETMIGAGAVVIQGIRIGARSVVAGGALVRLDVAGGTMVAGVPAVERKA